jgi:VCBS repeat-containing protein
MKHLLFLFLASAFMLPVFAQQKQRASPHDTVKAKDIEITYGRPYKKNREIFGSLVKYGEVWRTGADEATQITFKKDATFGGKAIKAGTYTLFTIPTEGEWTVILNSQLKQWGAYDYTKNKDKDVLQVKVPSKKIASTVEQLTIIVEGSNIVITWDQTMVTIPVKI